MWRSTRAAVLGIALLPGSVPAATLGGPIPVRKPLFPSTNWWNLDISDAPVDPSSASYIAFIGAGAPMHPDFGGEEFPGSVGIYGFPYVVVDGSQPKRTVQFLYSDESDGVDHSNDTSFPFYPIPDEAITQPHWIEGGEPGNQDPGGDRHMLIVDAESNHLYELYDLFFDGTEWHAGSGAFFEMSTNDRRPEGWTSADAAGLAILPGLVRYDEVYGAGEIEHAFRVTVRDTNGHVYPASHTAGSHPQALPMGARLRLKASVDLSGYPAALQKIFRAMKKYGLIVADNGTDMYVSGTFDTRWDNDVLNPAFHSLTASDFEVVQLGYQPPVLDPIPGPLVVGKSATLAGSGFRAGSVVRLFVASAGSVTAWGPFAPAHWSEGQLTWNLAPSIFLGNGFGSVMVINTDDGYTTSNVEGQLLHGDPAWNLPTILVIEGVPLSSAEKGIPLAHADTTVPPGATVTLEGTGFHNPLVDLFTPSRKDTLVPLGGASDTAIQVVIPADLATGPGSFRVINDPYTGNVLSNGVSVQIGATPSITTLLLDGSTVTVQGEGFCSLSVINLFNQQGSGVFNLGGVMPSGAPRLPITLVDDTELSFALPAGADSGPAFVQILNPPFIPFSSSGNDPAGAFMIP